MVVEPFVRMGPLPRSLAAEAHVCFMVRSHVGPTEYKFAARAFAPQGGLPSVRLLSTGGIAAKPSPPNRRQAASCGIPIPLCNGEQCMPPLRQAVLLPPAGPLPPADKSSRLTSHPMLPLNSVA